MVFRPQCILIHIFYIMKENSEKNSQFVFSLFITSMIYLWNIQRRSSGMHIKLKIFLYFVGDVSKKSSCKPTNSNISCRYLHTFYFMRLIILFAPWCPLSCQVLCLMVQPIDTALTQFSSSCQHVYAIVLPSYTE